MKHFKKSFRFSIHQCCRQLSACSVCSRLKVYAKTFSRSVSTIITRIRCLITSKIYQDDRLANIALGNVNNELHMSTTKVKLLLGGWRRMIQIQARPNKNFRQIRQIAYLVNICSVLENLSEILLPRPPISRMRCSTDSF